ncbi:hypothetical protein CDAR_271043 [Caerostris darwini]|uniref:Uncharacterized protein n=1 Tax=Caerostris darwini TaxID=1538125 RepID=A0AAV4TEI0_9ARAC|nr:hypothetical protein CDAR_271043 [Caerostris darwini]
MKFGGILGEFSIISSAFNFAIVTFPNDELSEVKLTEEKKGIGMWKRYIQIISNFDSALQWQLFIPSNREDYIGSHHSYHSLPISSAPGSSGFRNFLEKRNDVHLLGTICIQKRLPNEGNISTDPKRRRIESEMLQETTISMHCQQLSSVNLNPTKEVDHSKSCTVVRGKKRDRNLFESADDD